MEPDASIETSSMIRVAVLPIGPIIPSLLREYLSLLVRYPRVELSTISSFYTEHQKSPFSHQPWDSGSLYFKFMVGGSPPSPWEDFQSNRKILAVIGFCHCPSSPDLNAVLDQFGDACKKYSSALVKRCFAFQPSDSQLVDDSQNSRSMVLFPPADRKTQEFHLHTMMQDVAASLLMELEKRVLQAESSGTILKTPLDSQASLSSEEVIKAKKRRLGRAQKTIADYCLLAGSPVDANDHYSTSLELARLTGDYFWYAGALEGSVCALLIDRMGQSDVALEEEVRYRYGSVILHYRKSFIQDNSQRVSPLSFELEATLKLARFLCRRDLGREVVELLTTAADGAKSLIDANDRLVLYVEIARLFGNLGYHRKEAFFSRQVSQLYLQQDSREAAICAMQVLTMATKAYHIESRASVLKEVGSLDEEGCKFHCQSIISLFESQWSTLQMVVLKEVLISSVRAGDLLTAWSAAARLLRSYYPLITPAGQNGLAGALIKSAERLPSETHCADPALPFIRVHSFPLQSSQLGIINRSQARQDWWAGSAPSGPFIYTPFHKGDSSDGDAQEVTWVVGEQVQVLVELANPCAFSMTVDSLSLSVKSGNFDAYPVSVKLPPNSSKVITLSGIPTSIGHVSIHGCIVNTFGIVTEHLFKDVDNLLLGAAQGLVLSDPFRCCGSARRKNASVPNISVVPPLPLLVSHIIGGDSAIILYEGEIRDVWISFANAGTVPVEEVHITFSGKNQESIVSVAYEALEAALPLKPGAEVTLPVRLKAWHLGLLDNDITPSRRHSKDTSSPVLVIHYAGPTVPLTSDLTVPPGRRLVVPLHMCVMQGLSFTKACLLSMEIPARVGESISKSGNSLNRMDGLVKMDPYRGSWGLRLLELELSNPTDVVFEIKVSVIVDDSGAEEIVYPKTRIDRDYSSRVLIPLENFKLPILDASSFMYVTSAHGDSDIRRSSLSEKTTKAELDGLVRNLISRIRVRWQSGRNSSGELNIRDATLAALETSVMDIMLPDPLTFSFQLAGSMKQSSSAESISSNHYVSKSSILHHSMTSVEVLVRNNTRDVIRMTLNITCRDVTGQNCIEGDKTTILCAGVLNGIAMEVPPLQEATHPFSLYFLVPGEYTLWAAAMIENPNDILRIRAKTESPRDPIFCRGAPFNVRVKGTT